MRNTLFKWAGGKHRVTPLLQQYLPKDPDLYRHDYIEPFCGAGSLFFSLCDEKIDTPIIYAQLYDTNPIIIKLLTFLADPWLKGLLLTNLERLQVKYDNAGDAEQKKQLYLELRDAFNEMSSMNSRHIQAYRAALFLYILKAGFNGLYRVNRHGLCNTPPGDYKSIKLIPDDRFEFAHKALQRSVTDVMDFRTSMLATSRGSSNKPIPFYYLDPPYIPSSPTASFTSYTKKGFNLEDHKALALLIEDGFSKKKGLYMLSMSDTPLSREVYKNCGNLHTLDIHRSISSKASTRGDTKELIITTY